MYIQTKITKNYNENIFIRKVYVAFAISTNAKTS